MPRVLVIDDQSDVRAMISIVLRINHFEIVEAATAAAGLEAFENASFDLAIVDIFLQGTNGSDLITTMRERVPDLPVVAISGMTALDFLTKSPGVSDVVCLQKPFRPNELIACDRSGAGSGAAIGKCRCGAVTPARSAAVKVLPTVRRACRALPFATDLMGTALIGRRVARRERNNETADEALRHASRIRPAHRAATRCWRSRSLCRNRVTPVFDPRPAGLRPYDVENACLDLPADLQPARQRRQRAILGRIGDEFVQGQATVCAVAGCSWTSAPRNAI